MTSEPANGVDHCRDAEPHGSNGASCSSPAGSGHEVMLQGFNWECHSLKDNHRKPCWYRIIAEKAAQIADAGITAVWLPPPSQSLSNEGYLPQQYECLDSQYGSEADLRHCIAALKANGVKVIADLVLNHRCAQAKGKDDKWNAFTGRYNWDASCICSGNTDYGGTGVAKEEEDFCPAPNLDHTQDRVRQDLKHFLTHLRKDVGFDAWRFDFAKGYKGEFVREYIEATQPAMAVGEYWDTCGYDAEGRLEPCQDAHRQRIIDWCDATGGAAAAFDFTTKAVLQEALEKGQFWRLQGGDGKPTGVIGWWPSHAVTFLDNHDTGSTQGHWPFPSAHLGEGYAYILMHPGTPCIFYDHLWHDGNRKTSMWGSLKRLLSHKHSSSSLTASGSLSGSTPHSPSALSSSPALAAAANMNRRSRSGSLTTLRHTVLDLLALRRRLGIHCRSQVTIRQADDKLYAATVDNKLAVKIGPGSWSPDGAGVDVGQQSWALAVSGWHFAVWEAVFAL